MSVERVDEDFIRDKIESKIQEAHRDILSRHDIESGDVTPSEQRKIDNAIEELVRTTREWIISSIKILVHFEDGLKVYSNSNGELEIVDEDTDNKVFIQEEKLEEIVNE